MYCGNCGNQLKENVHFCGKCGHPVKVESKVIYVEENKLPSILGDGAVVALMFGVLILSLVTIACASSVTQKTSSDKTLQEKVTIIERNS